ncbi:hypothetical protein BC940DRAFT_307822 [Gongronella butleri]|nr:hypothetical protein BC940DRAFT_307822 [Gongronella butleri]
MQLLAVLSVTLALVSTVFALPLVRRGYSIQLVSDSEFCAFMPPSAGDNVGATENDGIPMCTNSSLGGTEFPQGFILSATYRSTDTYAQVRATIDPAAYGLSRSDGGGQYDHKDISGVTCNGYKYFVNILEPDSGDFCIRCCQDSSDCNVGRSEYGCDAVVPA